MAKPIQFQALTIRANGTIDRIVADIAVTPGFDPDAPPTPLPSQIQTKALWDTGATKSVLSTSLVKALGLTPVGTSNVHHGDGTSTRHTYIVNFYLGTPRRLDAPVNPPAMELYPSIAGDGTMYFSSSRAAGTKAGGSFRREDRSWTAPQNLGAAINSPYQEYCPSVSPDGKYFFFSSYKRPDDASVPTMRSLDDILRMHRQPYNGAGDVYWVDAAVIHALRENSLRE